MQCDTVYMSLMLQEGIKEHCATWHSLVLQNADDLLLVCCRCCWLLLLLTAFSITATAGREAMQSKTQTKEGRTHECSYPSFWVTSPSMEPTSAKALTRRQTTLKACRTSHRADQRATFLWMKYISTGK